MRKTAFILLALLLPTWAMAESPKREFRASWITTVWAIDWPKTQVTTGSTRAATIQAQKNELTTILDALQSANMNAAYFQVRGFSDAMYQSSYEPWSQYLTGTRGSDPGYDPLAFAITEAHARGMELYAWINPYRYSTSADNYGTLATDYANTHPDWLMSSDSYTKILNPGIPEVVQQIKKVIAEIVVNYNVDGIVFDDYFYINGGTSNASDQAQYDAYNPDNLSRGDWRRQNVNKMVRNVYDTIQQLKPYVKFGISPAGVAASSEAVASKYGVSAAPVGSDWQYNGIYSDPLAWLSEGSIDFISPQIYWTIGSSNDYSQLCAWWSDIANHFGKHLYVSHSLSGMTAGGTGAPAAVRQEETSFPKGMTGIEQMAVYREQETTQQRVVTANFYATEIGAQIDCNRNDDKNDAPGSVFYATNKVVNTAGFTEYLKNKKFTQPALTPAIGWKSAAVLPLVTDITLEENHLIWNCTASNVRYAVYCIPKDSVGKAGCFATSIYLLGLTYDNVYAVSDVSTSYTYAVSVVDRYGNESAPMVCNTTVATAEAATLAYPANNAVDVLLPCKFRWNQVTNADSYCWQLAEDSDFTQLVCSRETVDTCFYSGLQTNLEENKLYYWRVRTRKANAVDIYSDTWQFTGNKFGIVYPANGASDVPIVPTITWDNTQQPNTTYTIEIATDAKFTESKRVYLLSTQDTSVVMPENTLTGGTVYYARVTVAYADVEAISETVTFITEELPVPVPEIISPENNAVVYGTSIEVCWKEQNAKKFRVELSASASFPPRATTVKSVDAYTYCTTYTDLESNTYYIRVKALKSEEYTDPSEVITVQLQDNTPVSEVYDESFNCTLLKQNGLYYLQVQTVQPTMADIKIYSFTGTYISHKKCNFGSGKQHVQLDVESLPNGLYAVEVQTETDRKILKLQK